MKTYLTLTFIILLYAISITSCNKNFKEISQDELFSLHENKEVLSIEIINEQYALIKTKGGESLKINPISSLEEFDSSIIGFRNENYDFQIVYSTKNRNPISFNLSSVIEKSFLFLVLMIIIWSQTRIIKLLKK